MHESARSCFRRCQIQRLYGQIHPLGIDDEWRLELMAMVNELSPSTGIHIQLDEEY